MTYWLHGKKGFDKPLPAFDKYVYVRHSNEHHPSQYVQDKTRNLFANDNMTKCFDSSILAGHP